MVGQAIVNIGGAIAAGANMTGLVAIRKSSEAQVLKRAMAVE